jgi:predicted nucleic-acid-binding protein
MFSTQKYFGIAIKVATRTYHTRQQDFDAKVKMYKSEKITCRDVKVFLQKIN